MDRGAWGLETLLVLSALKLAEPQHVTLLRGNHESSTCTQLYGFRTEVFRKYGAEVGPAPPRPDAFWLSARGFTQAFAWPGKTLPGKGGVWHSGGRGGFSRPAPSRYQPP